jgi:hypothetical protein
MADVRCKGHCPAGGRCCCDGRVEHHLHICSVATCSCHTLDRYTGRLQVLDVGRVDPLGMHWRAATVLTAERREGVGV